MPSRGGARAAAGRLLASPFLFVACLVPTLLAGAGLALALQPEPHSDWAYYWAAAGQPLLYERGGLGLWLLALPKALGLSAVASALCVNLLSAAAMLWLARRVDRGGAGGLWLASAAYLLLLAPFLGLVQLDLFAATSLAAGMWLAADAPGAGRRRWALAAAVVLVATAVSTKPQYALVLWAMLGLLAVPWLIQRRRGTAAGRLLVVLLAGSILGFAIDQGLRAAGDRGESIRTSSAVTLYAGLLVSGDGEGCGAWSLAATRAAMHDRRKPLHQAVVDRLSAKPASHWASVVACKLPGIVVPPPYALNWLSQAPNVRATLDADLARRDRMYRAMRLERRLYGALALAILALAVATTAVAWRRRDRVAALLPLAWIASFWLVHLVFEIQGRYFLGLYLLAPLLCAMALPAAAAPVAPAAAGPPGPGPATPPDPAHSGG